MKFLLISAIAFRWLPLTRILRHTIFLYLPIVLSHHLPLSPSDCPCLRFGTHGWLCARCKCIYRSLSTSTLVVQPTCLSTGDIAFPVAVARTWNSLPTSLTSLSLLASFRRQLKTELFVRSFPDLGSSAYDRIWLTFCSHFTSHSHFVTVLAL